MIEFLFGTLIQILFVNYDINNHLGIKLWTKRFWKYSIITAIACHLFFPVVIYADLGCIMIFFLYIILIANMIRFRNEENWIKTKDILRIKILLNYIYIGVASISCLLLYSIIFGNDFSDVYEITWLFYILSIPVYLLAILIRKVAKKYVSDKNKSKNCKCNGSVDGNVSRSCKCKCFNNTNDVWLAQRETFKRQRNNAIYNLIGYGMLLFLSYQTGTLRYYITFLTIISILRGIFEPLLSKNGYFIKHCDVWKDCFSNTHLLYFIALYFCNQSNYDIAVLSTIAIIANFETIRRKDDD